MLKALIPPKIRRRIGTGALGVLYRRRYDRLFVPFEGRMASTRHLGSTPKRAMRCYFQHREKAEATLAAATSWYGGDYMEFGACDLYTFRNMLSAFDLAGLDERFPDTRFYAFDIFGRMESDNAALKAEMAAFDASTSYFSMQFPRGDDYQRHLDLVKEHNLFVDRCHLVQGFFQDTLNDDFKASYRPRQIGYAFIDCNFEAQYKVVFEFIFDLMAESSHIYMDEYFQAPGVPVYFDEFARALRDRRGIECLYVRPAGAFGALFRLRPTVRLAPLNFRSTHVQAA